MTKRSWKHSYRIVVLAVAGVMTFEVAGGVARARAGDCAPPPDLYDEPFAEYRPDQVVPGQRYQRVDKILRDLVPKIKKDGDPATYSHKHPITASVIHLAISNEATADLVFASDGNTHSVAVAYEHSPVIWAQDVQELTISADSKAAAYEILARKNLALFERGTPIYFPYDTKTGRVLDVGALAELNLAKIAADRDKNDPKKDLEIVRDPNLDEIAALIDKGTIEKPKSAPWFYEQWLAYEWGLLASEKREKRIAHVQAFAKEILARHCPLPGT